MVVMHHATEEEALPRHNAHRLEVLPWMASLACCANDGRTAEAYLLELLAHLAYRGPEFKHEMRVA